MIKTHTSECELVHKADHRQVCGDQSPQSLLRMEYVRLMYYYTALAGHTTYIRLKSPKVNSSERETSLT